MSFHGRSMTKFTPSDVSIALAHGWILADDCERGLEIQRFDDAALFDDDADALFYVRLRAAKGDATAQRALDAIARSTTT